MEPMEQLAYGVRTLLGSFFIHPVSDGAQTPWALLCALTVGGLVVRRDPIKSSGRLFMVAEAACGLSLFLFLDGVWWDPVFPCVASTVTFLLVTQLTFRMEQSAKERNRFLLDRFVAPQAVDELLAPGMANFGVGGRRERVTVLFADVRGFTQFAERHLAACGRGGGGTGRESRTSGQFHRPGAYGGGGGAIADSGRRRRGGGEP
jgi:adenylate cyclase